MPLSRRQAQSACAAVVALAAAFTWAVRSRYLFDWDSANFALGMVRIDILHHQPHPPGYLGYVFAGRLLRPLLGSANDALIGWNLIALAMAGAAIARLAASRAEDGHRRVIATLILVSSPLVLFYATTAEIYFPELAVVTVIAAAVDATLRGSRRGPLWCALAFLFAALFKISSALFMVPLILYGLWRAPLTTAQRRAALALLCGALAVVAVVFLIAEPAILSAVREQFLIATRKSRIVAGSQSAGLGRILNRNLRDTLIACLAGVGLNVLGVVGWLAVTRRLPPWLDRGVLLLWALPWCVLLLLLHIGKPGYALPLIPVLVLLITDFYGQLGARRGIAMAGVAAVGNVAWFMAGHALVPAEPDARPYAEKSVLQRMASDLEPLTYMTAGTVRQSDRQVAALQAALARCDAGAWVIVAGGSVVDWRRVMVYAPTAVAVQDNDDGTFGFIARDGRFESIRDAEPVSSRCGLLWIGERPPRVQTSARAEHVADLGWRYNPGTGAATVRDLRWDASP